MSTTTTRKPRKTLSLNELKRDVEKGRALVKDRLFSGDKVTAVVTRSDNDRIDEVPPPEKRASLLGKVELTYLTVALDKLASPLHPNFIAALQLRRRDKETPTPTERMWHRLRVVSASAYDAMKAGKCNIKAACALASKNLKDDARCYVQFWKELMKAVAFTAHIEASLLERHVDSDVLASGSDAMYEEHDITDDIPMFDMAEVDRLLPREQYAGGETRRLAASSVEEVYSAVRYVQAWIGLAFQDFEPNKAEFWGVSGEFPLDQEVIQHAATDTEYKPIRDFDHYRAWRRRQWSLQQRVARMSAATEDLLING